ncbi:MAG: hypothetical protein QOH31_5176 [Verrucomicrobiota bacterium]|jgi:hypothetical protein
MVVRDPPDPDNYKTQYVAEKILASSPIGCVPARRIYPCPALGEREFPVQEE